MHALLLPIRAYIFFIRDWLDNIFHIMLKENEMPGIWTVYALHSRIKPRNPLTRGVYITHIFQALGHLWPIELVHNDFFCSLEQTLRAWRLPLPQGRVLGPALRPSAEYCHFPSLRGWGMSMLSIAMRLRKTWSRAADWLHGLWDSNSHYCI